MNSIYDSPSDILQIKASFQSLFQKFDMFRPHWSNRSQGMNWLAMVISPCGTHISIFCGSALLVTEGSYFLVYIE